MAVKSRTICSVRRGKKVSVLPAAKKFRELRAASGKVARARGKWGEGGGGEGEGKEGPEREGWPELVTLNETRLLYLLWQECRVACWHIYTKALDKTPQISIDLYLVSPTDITSI